MTLVLKKVDKERLREFKAEAVRRGLTFSEAFEEALSTWLLHKRGRGELMSEVEVNNECYESLRKELEKEHKGKVAVIAQGRLIGVYGGLEEAAATIKNLKQRPNHAIVTKVGVDKKGLGEWLGGFLEL